MTDSMASFTERRSYILTAHSPLPIHSTIPLLVEFFKRKPSLCHGSEYKGLRPWDEQCQINFAKINMYHFSKMCSLPSTENILFWRIWYGASSPLVSPLPGSLIKMSKAFSHFTEILWLLGCWHDGNDKQVEGQSAQRNWLYIELV